MWERAETKGHGEPKWAVVTDTLLSTGRVGSGTAQSVLHFGAMSGLWHHYEATMKRDLFSPRQTTRYLEKGEKTTNCSRLHIHSSEVALSEIQIGSNFLRCS